MPGYHSLSLLQGHIASHGQLGVHHFFAELALLVPPQVWHFALALTEVNDVPVKLISSSY